MTAPDTPPDRAALAAEAEALEAAIRRLGEPSGPPDARSEERREIEARVLRLCTQAQALPAAEARSLAEPLGRLIAELDAAAGRLKAAGAGGTPGDSAPNAGAARRAAAAYGSAAGRRRRGF